MSKKEKNHVENENTEIKAAQPQEEVAEAAGTVDAAENGSDTSRAATEEIKALAEALSQKENENRELMDRMQRLAAEFDNFKKRTQKEKEKLYCDSCIDVVAKFLPVADNLERAIKASEGEEGQSLKDGVSLVYRQIADALEKLGVKPIEAVGQTFDPNLHNAVMHIEDEAYGAGEVVEEFQKGYIYKDETVIRYSMVKVAN